MDGTPFFELDRDALAEALEGALDEFCLDSHEGWSLSAFGAERLGDAIRTLSQRAFEDWGCLKQPPGPGYEVVIYDLFSEGEWPLILALRPSSGSSAQLASLIIDGTRLADEQRQRHGMGVLADILETLVFHANTVIEGAQALPVPSRNGNGWRA